VTTSAAKRDDYLPWDDPEFALNPYPWFERLRKEKPVYEAQKGIFVVTRYEDIITFGRPPYITILNPVDTAFYDGFAHTVLGLEPPEHTKKRAAYNPWLTPKGCREFIKAGVAAINAELDTYRDGEVIDGHIRLGIVPTHAIICAMLEVPTVDPDPQPAVLAMLDVMRGASAAKTAEDEEAAARGFAYLRGCVERLLAIKRENPGGGLADTLIEWEREGAISADEMMQTLSLFWGSGAHNPSYLMGVSLEFFANNPEIYQIFRFQPEKRKAVLSEILRLFPPELAMVRYATENFEMHGVEIPKGAQIRFMLNSANRDPEAFPDPDTCNLDRPLRPSHLTFGFGHHGCAGAVLAYMEGEALLAAVADRVERIELAGESSFDAHERARAYLKQSIRLKMA
jgi:cytochrome P450